jgi:hypothetical protein
MGLATALIGFFRIKACDRMPRSQPARRAWSRRLHRRGSVGGGIETAQHVGCSFQVPAYPTLLAGSSQDLTSGRPGVPRGREATRSLCARHAARAWHDMLGPAGKRQLPRPCG